MYISFMKKRHLISVYYMDNQHQDSEDVENAILEAIFKCNANTLSESIGVLYLVFEI